MILKQGMKKYNDVGVPSRLAYSKGLTYSSLPLFSVAYIYGGVGVFFFLRIKKKENNKDLNKEGFRALSPKLCFSISSPAGAAWWENCLFLMTVAPWRCHL